MTIVLENEDAQPTDQDAAAWIDTASRLQSGAARELLNSLPRQIPMQRTYATKLATRDEVALLRAAFEDLEGRVYALEEIVDYLQDRDAKRSNRFWSFIKTLSITSIAYGLFVFASNLAHQAGLF